MKSKYKLNDKVIIKNFEGNNIDKQKFYLEIGEIVYIDDVSLKNIVLYDIIFKNIINEKNDKIIMPKHPVLKIKEEDLKLI
jgi:hypothetical protein